jgi:hypothetical protein
MSLFWQPIRFVIIAKFLPDIFSVLFKAAVDPPSPLVPGGPAPFDLRQTRGRALGAESKNEPL